MRAENGQLNADSQTSLQEHGALTSGQRNALGIQQSDDVDTPLESERLEAVEKALIALALKIDALTLRMEEHFAHLGEMQTALSSEISDRMK